MSDDELLRCIADVNWCCGFVRVMTVESDRKNGITQQWPVNAKLDHIADALMREWEETHGKDE